MLRATPSELQDEVHLDRLVALSRLWHEVLARIRAARSGNPGEFFAFRKRVQLTLTLNMLTLTLDVVDQLLGGVGRLHFVFVPFDWLLKWSSCSR